MHYHFIKENNTVKQTFLLTAFLMIITSSFSQWSYQNPSPHGHSLSDVKMLSPDTIIAVGDYGAMMRSVDAGNTWTTQYFSGVRRFSNVFFPDKQNGWAIAEDTSWTVQVFRSTDKGEHWILQSGIPDWFYVEDASFPDARNGWLVSNWEIKHTTNGGEAWERQTLPDHFWGYNIFFTDSLTGWIGGIDTTYTSVIYKSTDGGMNWVKLNFQIVSSNGSIEDICFINNSIGWMCVYNWSESASKIYKTQDGGESWELCYTSIHGVSVNSLYFSDNNHGWGVGYIFDNTTGIIHTSDGGDTWTFQNSEVTGAELRGIDFVNNTSGIIVGDYCTILKTNNAGSNWQRKTSGDINISLTISFLDQNIGYCAGRYGAMCKTTDGGVHWTAMASGTNYDLYSSFLIDSQTGWAGGAYSTLLYTNNGGKSWTERPTGFYGYIDAINFQGANHGWAIVGGRSIIGTTNGGADWNLQFNTTTSYLNDMFFLNNQKGWAVGDDYTCEKGMVVLTSDGGTTWNNLWINDRDWYYAVHFVDEMHGYIAGKYDYGTGGIILHTLDGGQTWQTQFQTEKSWFTDIQFVSPTLGWAIGGGGGIFHTSDGGQTWKQQKSGTYNTLWSISFVDENVGWVSGGGGTILHTKNGGMSWIREAGEEKANMLSVAPNPFREKLQIEYKLRSRETISLTLFDLHGNRIRDLFKGNRDPGEYSHSCNFPDLPAGPYLIKLQSGKESCTRKVIKH
jgi:photosystem II stability/assembly factor-like uncharacterized protein